MNVLSLFDGMSCGQIALNSLNIPYENYYASEIDKYAIQVTQYNYPNTIQLGDVTQIKSENLPKIDLLFGGSPCQSFSIAGSRSGFEGSSGLFWEFVRVLNEVKPTYFLFENVVMIEEWKYIISKHLKIQPIEICSSLFSAQQRKRLYWTNINYSTIFPNSKDVIADVLGINIINKRQNKILMKKINTKVKIRKYIINKIEFIEFLRTHKNKTINEIASFCNAPKTMVEHWFRTDDSFSIPLPEYWYKLKECLNITENKYDKVVTEFEIKDSAFDMSNRVYHIDGKHPTLTTLTGTERRPTITNGKDYFYLTPEHFEILQNVPPGYTNIVTDKQRFKMLGNGWTINVIKHILKGLIIKYDGWWD